MYAGLREEIEQLNSDISHFESTNDICTPMACVEEMVDAIPDELWKRETINVLDPCAGNGNFPLYVVEKAKHATVQANEVNKKRIANMKRLFRDTISITEKDFFTFEENELYDLVIANPPYAKFNNGVRVAKNHNVSRDFIKKGISVVRANGYLVYIVPDNWMSLSDRNDVVEILSQYQFIVLNIHGGKKYFPAVGSSFTWFVVKKTENAKSFLVQNFYKKETCDTVFLPKKSRNIPLFYSQTVQSILDKTLYSDNEKFPIETSSDLHKYTKKDILHTEKNELTAPYKVIHTQSQTIWSERPHKFQYGWKVFISLTSYYQTFIEKDAGATQSIGFIRCDSKYEAELIKRILDHPLYIFLNNIHRYGNFNNIRILQQFPIPKDANDIASSFFLTKNEEQYIHWFLS